MLKFNLERIANLIENDIQDLITQIVGKSDLADTVRVEEDNDSLSLFINDYVKFVEKGRKPKTKRVPISALVKWAKKKGISLTNNELYAIQQKIFVKGIVGKANLTRKIEQQYELSFNRYYYLTVEPQIENYIDKTIKIK